MKEIFITITGMNYNYGNDFVENQMLGKLKIQLEKEPDNKYDPEAIMAKLDGFGKIGYVSNSSRTKTMASYSAGRLYDKIGDTATATIKYKANGGLVCSVDIESIIGG